MANLREISREQASSSLGDLMSQLIGQVEQLLSAHLRLLRQEMATDGKQMVIQSAGIASGAILAILGVAFLGVALLNVLIMVMPAWAASLTVAAAFLLLGGLLIVFSIRRLQGIDPTNRTREETQETIAWLTRRR